MTGQIDKQRSARFLTGECSPITHTVPVDANPLHDVHSAQRTDLEPIRFDRIGNVFGDCIGNTDMHVGARFLRERLW